MKRPMSIVVALMVLGLAACSESNGTANRSDAPGAGLPGDLVFNRLGPDGELALFTIDLDGSDERQIRVLGDFVTLSPDGTRFIGAVPAPDGRIAPETFDADGSNYSVLSIDDPTLQLGDVRWSPDGARILAQGWDDTDRSRKGLYSVRSTDGQDLVRLTDPGRPDDYPITYSPDRTKVLFGRTHPPYDHHGPMTLMAVGADGSGLVRLNPPGTTAGLTFSTGSASWSPDSRQLAFVASKGSFPDDPRAVFVVDADGNNARRITPWNVTLIAQWSPDGTWIAFDMSRDSGPHDLFVVHPDGTERTQITTSEDGRFSFGPAWSPDSTHLLLVRGPGEFNDTDLWTVNVDGTGLVQVTHQPGEYGGYAWVPPG
jgi:hypothetical protein